MTYNDLLERLQDCEEIKEINYESIEDNKKIETLIGINVFLCHPDTIYFYEIQNPSHSSISIIKKKIQTFYKNEEKFNLILDLSRANIPTVDIRDKLKTVFTSENIKTVYVYVGKNIILKLAAKFVISAILNRNFVYP